jgi:DNA-binding response OmpR family regulator
MERRKKILIVDDEVINLEFFDVMLSKLGFVVEKAENGEQALETVRDFKPDLVILDNIMPKLSGWEVTKILKTDPAYEEFSEIPIIMFSALDDVKDKVEGFELGVEDYITKPYNFSEVLVRIRALLRTRELIAQLEQRETRIELTEKLNDGLISFAESLRAPFDALLARASTAKGATGEAAELLETYGKTARDLLSRLDALSGTISSLKEEEARLRENEIGIKALRGSLIRKA